MIVLPAFAFALVLIYLVITAIIKNTGWRILMLLSGFRKNRPVWETACFCTRRLSTKKKMNLPAVCVKFGTSKHLAFEGQESGTVSDRFYRNDVMSVDGFQKVRRKLCFTCKKRGLYCIEEAELVSYDMFFVTPFVHRISVEAKLCVYPSLISVERLILVFRSLNGNLPTRVPLFEDLFAFAGVREYTSQGFHAPDSLESIRTYGKLAG